VQALASRERADPQPARGGFAGALATGGFSGSGMQAGSSGGADAPTSGGFGGDGGFGGASGTAGSSGTSGSAGAPVAEAHGSCNIPATSRCSEVSDTEELIEFLAVRCSELGGTWSDGSCPITNQLVGCCRQDDDAACYYASTIDGMSPQAICAMSQGAVWDPGSAGG
jgi:hypothetical protein